MIKNDKPPTDFSCKYLKLFSMCDLHVGDIVISKKPLIGVKLHIVNIKNKTVYAVPLRSPIMGRDEDFVKPGTNWAYLRNKPEILQDPEVIEQEVHYSEIGIQCDIPQSQNCQDDIKVGDLGRFKDGRYRVIASTNQDGSIGTIDYDTNEWIEEDVSNIIKRYTNDSSCYDINRRQISIQDQVEIIDSREIVRVLGTFRHRVLVYCEDFPRPRFEDDQDLMICDYSKKSFDESPRRESPTKHGGDYSKRSRYDDYDYYSPQYSPSPASSSPKIYQPARFLNNSNERIWAFQYVMVKVPDREDEGVIVKVDGDKVSIQFVYLKDGSYKLQLKSFDYNINLVTPAPFKPKDYVTAVSIDSKKKISHEEGTLLNYKQNKYAVIQKKQKKKIAGTFNADLDKVFKYFNWESSVDDSLF